MTTTNLSEAKKPQGIRSIINSKEAQEQIARALPRHMTAERFARIAITATTRTPKLLECTQASLMQCLLDLSAMGLEPDGRRAHLIPYRDNRNNVTICTLIVDYKGLVELIRRSGDVISLRSETVCENDAFEWVNGEITHSVNWRKPRGEVEAVYAVAVLKGGETQTVTMTRDEVEGIRKRSRAGTSGPWITDWAEMAKKTAVRRLSKMLPLSSEIMSHVEKDDAQFAMRNVTPSLVVSENPILADPYAEPDPKPEQSLEPVAESPIEVSEDTERAELMSDIKAMLAEEDSTLAKFAPICRKVGLLADGVQLPDAPIVTLRAIHEYRLGILKGKYETEVEA